VDFDSLTGIAAQGESLFTEQSCMGCHCADATGGCVAGAPRVVGVAAETLDARLRGAATHPIKPLLTDQDIVDLEAFLASLSEP
jgi:cytochrome c553